ncbi:MAG: hypothetical protein IPJ16_16175 [Bacteroidales bacterium]|nr:hypothetical protein [Bacteroidales bacterium]
MSNLVSSIKDSMKRVLIIAGAIILILTSCEQEKIIPEPVPDPVPDPVNIKKDSLVKETIFRIGKDLYYKYSDIELYDSSTHILYFKTTHPEFDKNDRSYFTFFVNKDSIYKGDFWPSFLSSWPTRPYVSTWPFWLQNFALRFENKYNVKPDLRNDPRIIKAFKDHELLHSGLIVSINSVECGTSEVKFTFTLTNKDNSTLLFLDPEKMGLNLFHYYTNGLLFRKLPWTTATTTVKIPYQAPAYNNMWKREWLSVIKPGESKTFVINYPISSQFNSGDYEVTFNYPGLLFQVSRDELIQADGRIWLGDFMARINIVIK